jgi:hypothetical protein
MDQPSFEKSFESIHYSEWLLQIRYLPTQQPCCGRLYGVSGGSLAWGSSSKAINKVFRLWFQRWRQPYVGRGSGLPNSYQRVRRHAILCTVEGFPKRWYVGRRLISKLKELRWHWRLAQEITTRGRMIESPARASKSGTSPRIQVPWKASYRLQ